MADNMLGYSIVGGLKTLTALEGEANVKMFGAVGDGTTDDTAAIQAAIDSFTYGGGVFFPPGKYYISSNLTVKRNVFLRGASHNISEELSSHTYTNINNIIYVAPTATIKLNDGATIDGFQILSTTLRGALPFASEGAAIANIASWSGIAITQNGCDVKVSNCFIGGFAQAFKSDSKERTKIEWVNIDCIAGIWIKDAFDIPRISNVHCWPFIPVHQAGISAAGTYPRSGSAFKTTGNADAMMFTNCFSYGYAVGFDIQTQNAMTIAGCYADSGSYGIGQIGFKLSVNAELISIVGGGSSGTDIGCYINADTANCGKLILNGVCFWGNLRHIVSAQHGSLGINGCIFSYTSEALGAAITLESGLTGATNITSNMFSGQGYAMPAYSIDSGISASKISISNNIFNDGATTTHGNFLPPSDNAFSIGASGSRWSAIWAATGTIQTSDERSKMEIAPSSLGLDFINTLRPVSYKFKVGGVAEHKEFPGNRTHWGLIAQEVKTAADVAGVDFAGWVKTVPSESDSEEGLRYDEFIAPLIRAIQELSAEVAELKTKRFNNKRKE